MSDETLRMMQVAKDKLEQWQDRMTDFINEPDEMCHIERFSDIRTEAEEKAGRKRFRISCRICSEAWQADEDDINEGYVIHDTMECKAVAAMLELETTRKTFTQDYEEDKEEDLDAMITDGKIPYFPYNPDPLTN